MEVEEKISGGLEMIILCIDRRRRAGLFELGFLIIIVIGQYDEMPCMKHYVIFHG